MVEKKVKRKLHNIVTSYRYSSCAICSIYIHHWQSVRMIFCVVHALLLKTRLHLSFHRFPAVYVINLARCSWSTCPCVLVICLHHSLMFLLVTDKPCSLCESSTCLSIWFWHNCMWPSCANEFPVCNDTICILGLPVLLF